MPFCRTCGTQVREGIRFCTQCGESTVAPANPLHPPPSQPAAASGLSDPGAAALSYITIIPAIVFLCSESYQQRPFVRFHAIQSLVFTAAAFLVSIGLGILAAIPVLGLFAFIAGPVLALIVVANWIGVIISVLQGKWKKLGFVGAIAEQLAGASPRGSGPTAARDDIPSQSESPNPTDRDSQWRPLIWVALAALVVAGAAHMFLGFSDLVHRTNSTAEVSLAPRHTVPSAPPDRCGPGYVESNEALAGRGGIRPSKVCVPDSARKPELIPDGYYLLIGRIPDEISDFEAFTLYTEEYRDGAMVPVPLNGHVITRSREFLEFQSVTLTGGKVSFVTKHFGGKQFTFSGEFLTDNVQLAPHDQPVLRGRLRKAIGDTEVATFTGEFVHTIGE